MPQNPATATEALPVAALAAEGADPAAADARDEHPVPWLDAAHGGPDCLNGADCLVAEDAAGLNLRHVALQDVQVRATDRDGVDTDDRVEVISKLRVRDLVPTLLTSPLIHESAHDVSQGGEDGRDNSRLYILAP